MTLSLHSVSAAHGAKRGKKRVGRGLGSKGTTAGRGQKGQSSRAGSHGLTRIGMRHMMLQTPKLRGFTSMYKKDYPLNVGVLASKSVSGEVITVATLLKKGVVPSGTKTVKILANGEIKIPLTIKDCLVSASAKEKIMAAGGTVA